MKPCRSCGSTRVDRDVAPATTPGMQRVIVTCAGCGNRRSVYERRA